MGYRIPSHVGWCRAGDWTVFLDTDANRYFRLPEPIEPTFQRLLVAPITSRVPELEVLTRAGVLEYVADVTSHIEATTARPVRRSALEQETVISLGIADVLLTSACMLQARWILRRDMRHLSAVLREPGVRDASELSGEEALRQASMFDAARRLLPLGSNCLRDSAALQAFLKRRGVMASIVFGVRVAPFSAHCWVQVGDLALNETVDGTALFTPIHVL